MTDLPDVPRGRLQDLAVMLSEEHVVLGPLDHQDLEQLLHELLEWRTGERLFSIEAIRAGGEGIKGHVVKPPKQEQAA